MVLGLSLRGPVTAHKNRTRRPHVHADRPGYSQKRARRSVALPITVQVVRWLAVGQDGRRTQGHLPGRATALPTRMVLDQQTKPVIVVGHSYGGAVVSDGSG